jgi:WD40 repeat protein/serine/threonine protein kinase
VALKEVKPGSASNEAAKRLIKEAQITGQLQHPGIVPVYEVNSEGRHFYTMKLVKGETLAKAIRQYHAKKKLGHTDSIVERQLLSVFLNICDAIAYAHSRGVIHRDLKPENIVLGEYGEAIVLDWGLARQVGSDDEESAPIVVTEEGRTDATQAGKMLGTPAYMSPEQAVGRVDHMDKRTDTYGLGAILFEILTGEPPHRPTKSTTKDMPGVERDLPEPESLVAEMLHRIATENPRRVRSLDVAIPEELDSICATALARLRESRFQTAKELKAAILEFQAHEESINLTEAAAAHLEIAQKTHSYQDFNRALYGFEEALEQWRGNHRARASLHNTRLQYAHAAFCQSDFELALSLLTVRFQGLSSPESTMAPAMTGQQGEMLQPASVESDGSLSAEFDSLRARITNAVAERDAGQTRVRRLRRFSLIASFSVAWVACVAVIWINSERDKALTAQGKETKQRELAEAKEQEANLQRKAAVEAQRISKANENRARVAEAAAKSREQEAKRNLKLAERHAYNNDMLLAQREWNGAHIKQLRELLDRHRDRDDLRGFEWGYWDRLSQSELFSFEGRGSGWNRCSISPDGSRIAISSLKSTIKVWDAITGQEIHSLEGHARRKTISSVVFSPDGSRIASSSWDKTVKVWDAASGHEVVTFNGHASEVTDVIFSPEGTTLASIDLDKTLKLWDSTTGQVMHTLNGHTERIFDMAFSLDGTKIASAGGKFRTSGEVKVWDVQTGKETASLEGHTDSVTTVLFSPSGAEIVSAGHGGTIRVWDAASGKESLAFGKSFFPVVALSFGPDGKKLASGSLDSTVNVWDMSTGKVLLTLDGHTADVRDVVFSPDGTRLVSAGNDRKLKVWDAISGFEIYSLHGHESSISQVMFTADATKIVSGSLNGTVKVWDASHGQEPLALIGHSQPVWGVCFSPDGTQIVSASGTNNARVVNSEGAQSAGEAKVWDVASGQEIFTLAGHTGSLTSVAYSFDGTKIASGSDDQTVKLWDSTTGREFLTLEGHADTVTSVAFSSDGQRLVSASGVNRDIAGVVKVWDLATGQELLTLSGHSGGVCAVAFSPDGTRIASGSYDSTVKIWNAMSGKEVHSFNGHATWVYSVAFSHDGSRIASSSVSPVNTVMVWDAVSGQEIHTLKGHSSNIGGVAFTPDDTRIISAGSDGVKMWDVLTGQETLTLESRYLGHRVFGVDVSPDGTRIASAGSDGTVKLWDARPWTPELRAQSQAHGLLTQERDRVSSFEVLQATIRSDKTISDMVRQQALDWSELFWNNRKTENE